MPEEEGLQVNPVEGDKQSLSVQINTIEPRLSILLTEGSEKPKVLVQAETAETPTPSALEAPPPARPRFFSNSFENDASPIPEAQPSARMRFFTDHLADEDEEVCLDRPSLPKNRTLVDHKVSAYFQWTGQFENPDFAKRQYGRFAKALRNMLDPEIHIHKDKFSFLSNAMGQGFSDFMSSMTSVNQAPSFDPTLTRLTALEAIIRLRRVAVQSETTYEDLENASRYIVVGSKYPVLTALRLADMFNLLAVRHALSKQRYLQMEDYLTDSASDLVKLAPSDMFAALMLLQKDGTGDNAITLALTSKNGRFLSSRRISRLTTKLWKNPMFYHGRERGEYLITVKDWKLLVFEPLKFNRAPVGKFLIALVCDIALLINYTALINSRKYLTVDLLVYEWFILIFCIGNLVQVLTVLLMEKHHQAFGFFSNWVRMLDVCISLIYLFAFSDRINDPLHIPIYSIAVSFNSILLWARVSHLFVLLPTFGTLLTILFKMGKDIVNFFLMFICLLIGFAGAFYFCLRGPPTLTDTPMTDHVCHENNTCNLKDSGGNFVYNNVWPVEGFASFGSTLKWLFQANLGEFDYFSWFDHVPDRYLRLWCFTMLTAVLLAGAIVLLNLIIAMLSETFRSGQERATADYMLLRTKTIYTIDQQANILPSPFNLLVELLSFPVFVVECFLHKKGAPKTRYCPYCREAFKERTKEENDDLREELMSEGSKHVEFREWQMVKHLVCLKTEDLCGTCYRYPKVTVLHKAGLIRENISSGVFMLTLYIPMIIIIFPLVFIGTLKKNCCAKATKHGNRKRKLNVQKSASVARSSGRRTESSNSLSSVSSLHPYTPKPKGRNRSNGTSADADGTDVSMARPLYSHRRSNQYVGRTLAKEAHNIEDLFHEVTRMASEVEAIRRFTLNSDAAELEKTFTAARDGKRGSGPASSASIIKKISSRSSSGQM